jgi:predicted thioredoxin/glutaredoxin
MFSHIHIQMSIACKCVDCYQEYSSLNYRGFLYQVKLNITKTAPPSHYLFTEIKGRTVDSITD